MIHTITRQDRIDKIARRILSEAHIQAFKFGDSLTFAESARLVDRAILATIDRLMHYRSDPRSTTMATNTTTTSGMPQSACNSTNTGGPAGSGMKTAGGSVKTIDPKPGGTKITKVSGGGPSKNYSY